MSKALKDMTIGDKGCYIFDKYSELQAADTVNKMAINGRLAIAMLRTVPGYSEIRNWMNKEYMCVAVDEVSVTVVYKHDDQWYLIKLSF